MRDSLSILIAAAREELRADEDVVGRESSGMGVLIATSERAIFAKPTLGGRPDVIAVSYDDLDQFRPNGRLLEVTRAGRDLPMLVAFGSEESAQRASGLLVEQFRHRGARMMDPERRRRREQRNALFSLGATILVAVGWFGGLIWVFGRTLEAVAPGIVVTLLLLARAWQRRHHLPLGRWDRPHS